jgi:hypothetical protein
MAAKRDQYARAEEAAIRQGRVMTKKSYRSIAAMALAALIAGTATILPNFSERVVASAPIHSGKGDRLDIRPLGTKCSQQAWPYFEASCLRDKRAAMGKVQPARIVTADRLGIAR